MQTDARATPVRPEGGAGKRRLGLILPEGFPREVEAFACDFDRTLVFGDQNLPARTQAAVDAARARGIHVVVATGRMFRSVRPYLLAAGLLDPVVCYQGAAVVEPESGRFLLHEPIPVKLAKETIAAVEDQGYPVNCYVDDELYVARMSPEADAYARFQHLPVTEVGDLRSWLTRPPTKLVSIGDPPLMDELRDHMKERFDGRLFIAKSLPHFLEFASPNVTKGSGLAFVAEHVGFAPERTVAFGDGENDRELLQRAAFGIAVANADERLKAVADWVCPPVTEEGVAQVIEAFLSRSR